jgi:predicted RNA-binding protein
MRSIGTGEVKKVIASRLEKLFIPILLNTLIMCESIVFRIKDGEKKKLMENVTLIAVDGDSITLSGVFGESKAVKGAIKRVDSERHEVLIE